MKKNLLLTMLLSVGLTVNAQTTNVEVETGQFSADWSSLSAWECPEWFKDAKFGIWAHWGPQCHAEAGDWYARFMYYAGSGAYNWHVSHFGNPSTFGLKDLCNDWKAQNWNPEELVNLYKSVGARYFMALGNHHDNFDLWNSPYQEWNSVNVGPKKDIVKGWSDACKKAGLPLGVSIHASHAWTWLEPSQNYDGNLTKEDGEGTWWEGMDPQELYAQNHAHSTGWENSGTIHSQWNWGNGASLPSAAYKQKFQNRVLELINDYQPNMLYFDDTAMPFYGCDDNVGKNILTHYYNKAASWSDGDPQVVVTGKQLTTEQKGYMMWDVERGIPDRKQDIYWQTCTCIGDWHYNQATYNNGSYKSGATVIRMLVDIVSKNGNLLLSVPVKSDGTIDSKERAVLADIKAWMDINSESIYGTRTWKTFGEGPLAEAANPMNAQGFNEGQNYSSQDVRFVQKDGTVYATIMQWPSGSTTTFTSFSLLSPYYSGKVKSVRLLGAGDVTFTQDKDGLTVSVPTTHPNAIAPVYAITFEESDADYSTLQQLIGMLEEQSATLPVSSVYNTGKYTPEAVAQLNTAVAQAKSVAADADAETIANAMEAMRTVWKELEEEGTYAGGALGTEGTNLTTDQLVESSNFSRSDGGTTRFGTPEYWTVENFSIPQNNSNGTKNGIDKYPGVNCLMLGVWSGEDGSTTSDLSQARLYRRVTLPAGRYFFGAAYNTNYQLSNDAYIFAASSLDAVTSNIPVSSIAWHPISQATSGDGKYYGVEFTLEEQQDVYLGWQINLTQGSGTQEMRVERVILVDRNGIPSYDTLQEGVAPPAGSCIDITIEQLAEAASFSASTLGSRYGTPKNWTVENYNISSGQGNRNGIDKYPGYNCLSFGIWGDRNSNAGGAALMANARIYREVTLPAGHYYFGAQYETHGAIAKTYLFVADQLLETSQVETDAIACHNLRDGHTYNDNDDWLGVNFVLDSEKTVYLGWQGDLYTDNDQVEFRAKSVKLLRYVGTDLTAEKLIEANGFSTSEKGSRYGTPQYWTVENYNIPSGQGNRNGIDSNPGYNCLSLGIWNDLGSNSEGDPKNARIYRKVALDAGKYYFGASYNTVYNMSDAAYLFASTALTSTDALPDASTTVASRKLNSTPYFNSNKREEMYPITFTLNEPAEVYLGWQADLTQGSSTQEFRASNVKLVCIEEMDEPTGIHLTDGAAVSSSMTRYYDLEGRQVANGSASSSNLKKGIYLIRQGDNVKKVLVK